MTEGRFETSRPPFAAGVVLTLAALELALHMVVLAVTPFGIQRDAFLYFAMGDHLRLWHMDFPPMIAILGNVQSAIFGHTLAAARVFPALEGCAILIMAALIARELGGGRFAQGLAALPMLCAGIFLRPANLFQPVVLDQLWWTVALYFLARAARARAETDGRAERNAWLAFGVAMGLGLLTKFSILFIGLAILCAMLATRLRRALLTPWPWVAAAIAFALGSPSIAGQINLGFPVVRQMGELRAGQLVHVSYASFVLGQPLMTGVTAWLLSIAGAAALLAWKPLRAYRVVGLSCVFVFLLLMVLHGKAYYVGPIYPTLIAAGAVWLTGAALARVPSIPHVFRWGVVTAMIAEGVIVLPIALPILSPGRTAVYIARAGLEAVNETNWGGTDIIPQDFADQLGWKWEVRRVAHVYHSLSPEEQRETVLGADNYGEAGALEFYGGKYGLPYVVCGCGSYWFFGPGNRPGKVLIDVGTDSAKIAKVYGDVRLATRIRRPWSVVYERDVPVWIARDPKMTLQEAWPSVRGALRPSSLLPAPAASPAVSSMRRNRPRAGVRNPGWTSGISERGGHRAALASGSISLPAGGGGVRGPAGSGGRMARGRRQRTPAHRRLRQRAVGRRIVGGYGGLRCPQPEPGTPDAPDPRHARARAHDAERDAHALARPRVQRPKRQDLHRLHPDARTGYAARAGLHVAHLMRWRVLDTAERGRRHGRCSSDTLAGHRPGSGHLCPRAGWRRGGPPKAVTRGLRTAGAVRAEGPLGPLAPGHPPPVVKR